MGLGQLVVAAVRIEGRSKSAVARDYGVSRRWVGELCKRFHAEGEAGLAPRSRRPLRSPTQTQPEIENEIVRLRKWLEEQCLDAGAHTIAFHLERSHGRAPAPSTIWRILVRRGFVTPQPRKRPKSSFIRFQADQPNERWQADTTHWTLDDGSDVEILNILDDHSRLLVASHVRVTFKVGDVVASFHNAFAAWGFPASILTDNAAIFTAVYRGQSRCAIEVELASLGIAFVHSRPYHPQTCGKVERFHQTVKKWLGPRPADSIAELQTHIDAFAEYYNTVRPHRALDRRTPLEAFNDRPKASPSVGFVAPTHFRVRQDKIDKSGIVTLRHSSRLHHIGLGRKLAGERVLILVADLDVRILTQDGELIRQLTLDPSRDYQRQS